MWHYRKKERGLTLISVSIILIVIGFFTLLIFKIGPIYMNHSKVMNALSALEHTTDVQHKSRSEIRTILIRRFDINYVDHIDVEDVRISKAGGYLKVRIEYEIVEPIAWNLSVLVEFDDMIEVGET